MKHKRFVYLGDKYPFALEEKFDRILTLIDQLWENGAEIENYFSDLIIDKRGGRQGFPKDVIDDILMLRDLREVETIRAAERKSDAIRKVTELKHEVNEHDFFEAIESGDKVLVDLLIRSGVNVHVKKEGNTPLNIALAKGYTIIAHMLLDAGVDVDARGMLGLPPILLACGKAARGYKEVVEKLTANKANINVHDPMGNTPLMLAISGGTLDIAETLVKHGATINSKNKRDETAISMAQKAGMEAFASYLIEHANVQARSIFSGRIGSHNTSN